jgi:hypothetical protein
VPDENASNCHVMSKLTNFSIDGLKVVTAITQANCSVNSYQKRLLDRAVPLLQRPLDCLLMIFQIVFYYFFFFIYLFESAINIKLILSILYIYIFLFIKVFVLKKEKEKEKEVVLDKAIQVGGSAGSFR